MIFLILLFGLILRLISINQSFWLDEATSATVVRDLSFADIFTKFLPNDFHPPLYYLLLKLWVTGWGVSEISTRLLSVMCGLLTVYFVYLIATKISSKRVGVLASILLVTSGLHIYYSQEARMYSMTTFFAVLSVYYFLKIIKEGGVGDWLIFSLSLLLIASTDYVAILIITVFWIYGIITRKDSLWWKKFVMSHIILIIFGLLWSPTFQSQFIGGLSATSVSPLWSQVLGQTTLKNIFLIPVKFIIGRMGVENKVLYGLVVGVLGVIYGYPIVKAIRGHKLIWLWLTTPILLGIVISFFIPILSYFRFLFVLPAFYILIAIGSEKLNKYWITTIVVINLVFSLVYLLNPKFHREDWRGLVNVVDSHLGSAKDVIVFPSTAQREAFLYYNQQKNSWKKLTIVEPSLLTGDYDSVLLVRYVQEISDPEDKARLKIEQSGYTKKNELNFNGIIVWEYIKN